MADGEPKQSNTESKPSLGQRLSDLLGSTKPYREIIAIAVAAIVAISGGVAAIVAHFATEVELTNLECKLTHQLTSQLFGSQARVYDAQIDARQSQLKQFAIQAQPIAGPSLKQLVDEMADLKAKADAANKEATDQLNEAIRKCDDASSKNAKGP